jgi:hypothetical protein
MMPLGFSAAISARACCRQDGGIHVALADAPRDDLRVLRTKIQNDDLFDHEVKANAARPGRLVLDFGLE